MLKGAATGSRKMSGLMRSVLAVWWGSTFRVFPANGTIPPDPSGS